jgi:hypothetical protein
MSDKVTYRIINSDRTIKFAGTGRDSWFNLEKARDIVNYNRGESIYLDDGLRLVHEVL